MTGSPDAAADNQDGALLPDGSAAGADTAGSADGVNDDSTGTADDSQDGASAENGSGASTPDDVAANSSNVESSGKLPVVPFAIGGVAVAAGAGTGVVLRGGKYRKRGNKQ